MSTPEKLLPMQAQEVASYATKSVTGLRLSGLGRLPRR